MNHGIDAAAGFDQAARAAKIDAHRLDIAVQLIEICRRSNHSANAVSSRQCLGHDIAAKKTGCASDEQLHMRLAGSKSASTRRLAESISSKVTGGSTLRSSA